MKLKHYFLSLLALLASVDAFAEAVEIDGVWYNLVSKVKVAEVTNNPNGSYGYGAKNIPQSVMYNNVSYSVTSIGDDAFRNCSGLTSITIPNSVTSIGNYAFYGCSGLTSITIPNSVTSIGEWAFARCSGLTSITIPNSVTSIGSAVFSNCSSLTSVTIPGSVTSFGGNVFQYCSNLISATILEGLTRIESYTFNSCSNLISVSIPNSVTSIGPAAFYGCKSLASVIIPNSVTSIGGSAFEGCSNLTSVTLGSGVTYIYSRTFANCAELTDVYCYAENVPSTTNNAFEESYIDYATLHVHAASLEAYSTTAPWSSFGTIVAIEDEINNITFADANVKAICVANWDTNHDGELSEAEAAAVTDLGEAFRGNTTITSFNELQYFTGLTSLQDNAFKGCTNLTSFIIPRNVTSIGGDTFRDCKNLISISVADGNTNYDSRDNCNAIIETATNKLLLGCTNTNIPMGVTSIGVRAFQWCRFTSIDIPNSVSSIEEDAFSWCPNLTSFIIPEGVTTIAPITFYQCTSLTTITIPSSLKNVKTGAFKECSSLSKVIVSDIAAWCGIIYEGDDWNGDFPLGRAHHLYSDENTEITEVVIPEGVTRIEARAFRDADYVTSVTLPNSLTYIDQQAFRGMSHLTSINLPNGLTSLEHDLFSGCKALPTVTIPGSVTSIGSGAFWGCSSMNSINILDGVRIISQDAFDGCRSLTSITIPKSVTRVGLSVFQGCTSLTSMIVDEENTTYDSRNNCNAIVETATNTLIAGCQNTIIPESVTSIASYAFQGGCTGTTPVLVIPAGMRKIGDYSFDGCTGLTDVWCYATQVPNTSSNAFYDSFIQYKTLHVPAASLEAYSTTAPWSDFGTIIAIEEELNTENVDIASAENLANFAARVNAGEIALSATLKADIDFTAYPNLMIGNNSYYRGEFNGAGHSIKLALNRTSEHAALFYRLSGYVHDLTITGTITTSAKYAGGIAGETSNATIERCQSRVNIISTVNGDGTHGGIVGAARPGSIIRDCLFSGSITGSQTKCCGGVSGWSVGSVSITNCLIRSTFSVSTEDSDILSRNSSNVTSSNNYFQGTWDAANNCTDVTLLTENQVESGEACYLLNNGRTDDEMVWYQTLGVDDCPVPDKRRLAVLFDNGTYVNEQVANIAFADANVKAICVTNWDTNHDGELSEAEAAAVTDLGTVFKENNEITSFNELQYFTGLTSISNNAFQGCSSLTFITIPSSISRIGTYAFSDCVSLTSVTLPNSVTSIGGYAFYNCMNLKSVMMPASIITFEGYLAFGENNNIESVYITDLTKWLGIDFRNNNPLRSGAKLYLNNVEVKDLVIPEGTTTILTAAFEGYKSLTSVTIPNSVTSIAGWAFASCNNLATVTIAESVTSFGNNVFRSCSSLKDFWCYAEDIPSTGNEFFYSTDIASATLHVPAASLEAYSTTAPWSGFGTIVPIEVPGVEVTDISQLDNAIYIEPFSTRSGKTVNMDIRLKNNQDIAAYSFNLVLPEGVTLAKNTKDKYIYTLAEDRHDEHSCTINEQNGTYSIAVLSISGGEISGNDGTVITLQVIMDESMEEGDYPIQIMNAMYSLPNGQTINVPETRTALTIENILVGDVNDNKTIDIGDAVCIVNYIVGKPNAVFVEKAADVNGNGTAGEIGDAVSVVNIIVGKTIMQTPKAIRTNILDPQ